MGTEMKIANLASSTILNEALNKAGNKTDPSRTSSDYKLEATLYDLYCAGEFTGEVK